MAVHSKSCFSATSDSGNRRNYWGGGIHPVLYSSDIPYKAGKNLSVLPGVVIGKNGEGDRSKTNPTI